MILKGKQLFELEQALLSAYPTLVSLQRMVRFELEESLAQIADGENLRDVIFKLIEWAQSQGRLGELIEKAHAHNPNNAQLSSFARQVSLALPTHSQATSLPPVPPVAPHLFGRERFVNQVVEELVAHSSAGSESGRTASSGGRMGYRIALRGMAGVGKTALAKAIANREEVAQAFPDGRAWLSLGHQPDVFSLLGQLLEQFGRSSDDLGDIPGRADRLRSVLARKRFLLLVDDVWQSDHARRFLEACRAPACVLLTTRDREVAADLRSHNHRVWVLKAEAAVQMLADAGPNARLAVEAAPEESQKLVDELGYLPLALHVAGRRLARLARTDGASDAVRRLQGEIKRRLLTLRSAEGREGIPDAEPPLEAIIALSYEGLPDDATRQAFCRLAVLGAQPLDFDAQAMASVWQVESERADDLRATLVDDGLVEIISESPRRYALHQVIHHFALAQLNQDSEQNQTASLAHAQHYATRVQALDHARYNAQQLDYYDFLAQMDQEFPQIRPAIEWAHSQNSPQAAQTLRDLVIPLDNYALAARTLYHEYGRWLTQTQQACQTLGDQRGEADVLQRQGEVLAFGDRRDDALERYEQALLLFRAVGSRLGEANVLFRTGDVLAFGDRRDEALERLEQALLLFRAVGDRLGEANVLAAQSRLLIDDNPTESSLLLEQVLAMRERINDIYSMGADLGNYGIQLLKRGRHEEALPYLQRARHLFASRALVDFVAYVDELIAQAQEEPESHADDADEVD